MVSGTVATVFQGPGDLPMDHPLGDDLSMDVDLDAAFKPYSLQLGAAPSDTKPGQLHVEISSGLIPHLPATSAPAAEQTWRQLSDVSLQGFQPGFDHPAVGDRVLVEGRYIVDCGHPDYHTELHPISFLAWSHQEGTTSVVHVYGNAYWDTELFNPDLSVGGKVNDQARDTDPNTKPLPKYLIDEVGRLIAGTTSRLRTFELLGVMPPSSHQLADLRPGGHQRFAPAGPIRRPDQAGGDVHRRSGHGNRVRRHPDFGRQLLGAGRPVADLRHAVGLPQLDCR